MADFDRFLTDHAACERKASATAMSLVLHYPDRKLLVDTMIDLAREELEHFHDVYKLIAARGLTLGNDVKDLYIGALRRFNRNGRDGYFLDRLLLGGIIEARGCERFGMIAAALPPGELRDFYDGITRSEARHHGLFVNLAHTYFETSKVTARLGELLDFEAETIESLPLRAALH